MDDHGAFFRFGYFATAAIGGAVSALAFVRWKEMTRTEIALTLFGGFSFAIFVAPWIGEKVFGIGADDIRGMAALIYIFGSGSNILLPVLIRWVGRVFGNGERGNEETPR